MVLYKFVFVMSIGNPRWQPLWGKVITYDSMGNIYPGVDEHWSYIMFPLMISDFVIWYFNIILGILKFNLVKYVVLICMRIDYLQDMVTHVVDQYHTPLQDHRFVVMVSKCSGFFLSRFIYFLIYKLILYLNWKYTLEANI